MQKINVLLDGTMAVVSIIEAAYKLSSSDFEGGADSSLAAVGYAGKGITKIFSDKFMPDRYREVANTVDGFLGTAFLSTNIVFGLNSFTANLLPLISLLEITEREAYKMK